MDMESFMGIIYMNIRAPSGAGEVEARYSGIFISKELCHY